MAPYKGEPDVNYLEVGVYEGRSAFWIAENILTHESARLTVIDPFFANTEEVFRRNLARYEAPEKFTVIEGYSQKELPKLPRESFDIIYIDGSHTADDVLADAVMTFELLKVGGVLIFDDYDWKWELPAELRPMTSIDSFITAYRYRVRVIERSNQLVLRKLGPVPCDDKRYCTPIGDYLYLWHTERLISKETKEPLDASPEELELVRRYLRSRRFGADAATVVPEDVAELRDDPLFAPLMERLGEPQPGTDR